MCARGDGVGSRQGPGYLLAPNTEVKGLLPTRGPPQLKALASTHSSQGRVLGPSLSRSPLPTQGPWTGLCRAWPLRWAGHLASSSATAFRILSLR